MFVYFFQLYKAMTCLKENGALALVHAENGDIIDEVCIDLFRDDMQVFPQCISSVPFSLCCGSLMQRESYWKLIPQWTQHI